MTTTHTTRIGPQMIRAQYYVSRHPGCTQQEVAKAIGPNGSHMYGARAVQRALRAGMIVNESTNPRRYHLHASQF
jgi:hypothetical protein